MKVNITERTGNLKDYHETPSTPVVQRTGVRCLLLYQDFNLPKFRVRVLGEWYLIRQVVKGDVSTPWYSTVRPPSSSFLFLPLLSLLDRVLPSPPLFLSPSTSLLSTACTPTGSGSQVGHIKSLSFCGSLAYTTLLSGPSFCSEPGAESRQGVKRTETVM